MKFRAPISDVLWSCQALMPAQQLPCSSQHTSRGGSCAQKAGKRKRKRRQVRSAAEGDTPQPDTPMRRRLRRSSAWLRLLASELLVIRSSFCDISHDNTPVWGLNSSICAIGQSSSFTSVSRFLLVCPPGGARVAPLAGGVLPHSAGGSAAPCGVLAECQARQARTTAALLLACSYRSLTGATQLAERRGGKSASCACPSTKPGARAVL